MVFSRALEFIKYSAETVKGAVVVLASPNSKIPPTLLDPHMPLRPFTPAEWFRMYCWRYTWKYLPIFRFYVYSGAIVYGIYKFILPIKPSHLAMRMEMYKSEWKHHEAHFHHLRQNAEDKKYFKYYDPLRKPDYSE